MKQKFTTLFVALFAFIALSAANSFAANIAVLDIEKIAKEAKAVHDIQGKVAKKQEDYQKEINKKQAELESDQKKLENKKNILAKEAFEKEQKEFEKKIETLKVFVEKKQNSLKKASTDGMAKVNDKMKDIIAEMAKEKDLQVILPASQVVFSVDNLNITEEVLEKLNKKITKVDVKFE